MPTLVQTVSFSQELKKGKDETVMSNNTLTSEEMPLAKGMIIKVSVIPEGS